MHTPNRHLSADKRRAATVATVIALAGEKNPHGITTAAIAERMGVTQGALFRHFPTKDAILQAVMEWVTEHMLLCLTRARDTHPTPAAALEAMFMAHVGFVCEYPGIPRLLFGELQHAGVSTPKLVTQALLRRYGELLAELLERGRIEGEFAADLDIEAAITLFVGSIQGLVMQSLLWDDVTRLRREALRVFALYRQSIRSAS